MIRPSTVLGTGFVAVAVVALAGSCQQLASPPPIQIVGPSEKVERGAPLPHDSAIFDGHRVTLRLARGETFAVHVLTAGGTEAMSLEVSAPGVAVSAFAVGYLEVTEPSTSMYGPSRGPGAYPDILVPAQAPVTGRAALFDVAVEHHAPPGTYTGHVDVGTRAIPLTLIIEPATIDLRRAPLVWVYYEPLEIARAHNTSSFSDQLAWEKRYAALFRAHGAYLASDLGKEAFLAREALLDPSIAYWPVKLTEDDPQKMASDVREWIEIFDHRPQTPFAIPIDEPHTLSQRGQVVQNGAVIHLARSREPSKAGKPALLHGVTDRPRPLYGDTVDIYLSPHAIPRPRDVDAGVHTWTYNGRPPSAGSLIIDTWGTALRSWGWIAYRYDVELWYVWEGLYFTDRYNGATHPTGVMKNPLTFDERRRGGEDFGNGDGVLAYPGAIPSLRLKALRRGLQDRLLLMELARQCGADRAMALATDVVPRALGEARGNPTFPHHELAYARARQAVFSLLRTCDAR